MKGDAALACFGDWVMLCLAMGLGVRETDPAGFRQLAEEFHAKLTALSSSEAEALRQWPAAAAAWLKK
jgi:hypothetical protein